ncbi:hypothetical protein SAMN04487782_1814 [Stenotrophomonas maltophilia]|nr:hypothetical protein SAMN04487782_1813 [Stenotrophomonas maltophilia]SFR90606.1 hypothetical protein SAMN04487782_1814 [Stenotrophomonas maltophilia]
MPGERSDPPGMARRYRSEQAFALHGQVAFHQRGRQGIGADDSVSTVRTRTYWKVAPGHARRAQ